MRALELLIVVALLPVMLEFFFRRSQRPGWLRIFPWLALVLMLLHLGIEKYRWQMVPAYLLVVLNCLLATRKAPDKTAKVSRWRTAGRIAVAGMGLLTYAGTIFLAVEIPVFQVPPPSGPFAVGTTRLYFVDSTREDSFAPNPNTPRELLVVVWYPADVAAGAQPEPFWPDLLITGPAVARQLHAPSFFFKHMRLVKSHSYPDAPLARTQARYPVLIFSHGYIGGPWQNTVQMEELASHGFLVFSVGHTYESAAIPFPDGRVVPMSQARMDAQAKWTRTSGTVELLRQLQDTDDPAVIKRIATQMLTEPGWAPETLAVWVADTRYLVDQLEKINAGAAAGPNKPSERFARRLDLARLGFFGMSMGGATAGEFCLGDPRCKAGLNFDGGQFGDLINHPLSVPFMYFSSEAFKMNDPIYEKSRGDLYSVHIKHSAHSNFTDANLMLPILKYTRGLGAIGAQEMEKIMNAYTLAFFERYLQGKPAPLLDGPFSPSEFPDVVFKARKAPAAQ